MKVENTDEFPLSKNTEVKGSRRLAREKALQILVAYKISGIEWEEMFNHIFYRKFNFGDDDNLPQKLLTEEEVIEYEADIPIDWNEEEIAFCRSLIVNTIKQREFIEKLIVDFADNWDLDRIAMIDSLLMQMAVIELMTEPSVPVKVTINEMITIAKKYSTFQSGTFINGILNKLLTKLTEEGLIKKEGRGLIENSEF